MRQHGNQRLLHPGFVPDLNLARVITPEKLAERKELEAELGVLTKECEDDRARLNELTGKGEFSSVDWENYRVGMLELNDKRERRRDIKVDLALLPDPENLPKPPEPNAFQRWVREGEDGLSAEEVKAFCGPYEGMKAGKGGEAFRFSDFIRAGMRDGQVYMAPTRSDDDSGKQAVGTTIDPTVLQALKQYGGAVEAVRAIRTATGDTRRFLHMDDSAQMGAVLQAQNTRITDQDVEVEGVEMTAKTVTSKFVTVSVEFLADDESGMAGVIQDLCYRRIGRVMNFYLSDTQANFPNSIVDCLQNQVVKGGAVANFMNGADDWQKLVQTVFKVNAAYRNGMGETGAFGLSAGDEGRTIFMMHSDMEGRLLELKDGDSRPILIPNLREDWVDRIGRWEYRVNDQMDDIGTLNNYPLAFFNGNYYGIRYVGEMMFERFYDSATAATQTVKFLAKTRFDFGPLLYNAGTGRDVATRGPWGSLLQVAA